MTYTLTANSPITDLVLKSILKGLMSAKAAKKTYKQKYHQAKACMASDATHITTGDATVTNPTPAITTTLWQQY